MARRKREGRIQVYVKRTTRRLNKGRARRVGTGGVWRNIRPKGKKSIISKKPIKLYPVKDEFGRFLGYRSKR